MSRIDQEVLLADRLAACNHMHAKIHFILTCHVCTIGNSNSQEKVTCLDSSAFAMAGEGEYVPFAGECICDGPVETWLQNVVDSMRVSDVFLKHCMNKVSHALFYPISKWLQYLTLHYHVDALRGFNI